MRGNKKKEHERKRGKREGEKRKQQKTFVRQAEGGVFMFTVTALDITDL